MKFFYILIILLIIIPTPSSAQLDKAGSGASAQHKETITIVADTWCPYNCNPKSPHQGFLVDLATHAFAKHNIVVVYSIAPWAQAIAETRKGKYTAIVGASNNDAPDFIFPSIEQGFMENHFYVKRENPWRYQGIKSLKEVVLGLIEGYSYNEEIDKYIEKYRRDDKRIEMMMGNDALGINMNKIARGKISATLEAKDVMAYYQSQNNMKDIIEDAGALPATERSKLYIAFNPANKEMANRYAQILTQETNLMRASGELKKILDIYGLKDWVNK